MKLLKIHELLDRTDIVSSMFCDYIYDVVCDSNVPVEIRTRAKTIAHELGELYQLIGEYHAKSFGSR